MWVKEYVPDVPSPHLNPKWYDFSSRPKHRDLSSYKEICKIVSGAAAGQSCVQLKVRADICVVLFAHVCMGRGCVSLKYQ